MAPRFLQPAVCIAILACRSVARLRARAAARTDSRFRLSETAWLWSPVFPCFFCKYDKPAARGRGLRARNKKPGAVSRPGGWRTFGEYAFLEDSRYASQANSGGDLIWRSFLRFYQGIGRSARKAPGARKRKKVRLKSAYKDQSEIICSA
jgi:hypothetical protein